MFVFVSTAKHQIKFPPILLAIQYMDIRCCIGRTLAKIPSLGYADEDQLNAKVESVHVHVLQHLSRDMPSIIVGKDHFMV